MFHHNSDNYLKQDETSGRGRLWGPALGLGKILHTEKKTEKQKLKMATMAAK